MSKRRAHLHLVTANETPRTLREYLENRVAEPWLTITLGKQGLWLAADDAYGLHAAGDVVADLVHTAPDGMFLPVAYEGMRRLLGVIEDVDEEGAVVEASLPLDEVAVFGIRKEALNPVTWLRQLPPDVTDYEEVAVELDMPITLLDDEAYSEQQYMPLPRNPKFFVVR